MNKHSHILLTEMRSGPPPPRQPDRTDWFWDRILLPVCHGV